MDTITLKVKTTKPTQEIEFRFSETRSSKPIQFKIDWGDGTLNTQTSHVYKMPAIKKPYIIKISLDKISYFECRNNKDSYNDDNKYGIISLNASGCKSLKKLICTNQPLIELNIAECAELEYINCQNCFLNDNALRDIYKQLPMGKEWDGNIQDTPKIIDIKYNFSAYFGGPKEVAEEKLWKVEY